MLSTTVVVREAGTGAAILVRLKNISLSGCYLETPRQIRVGTRIRVILQTSGIHADLWAIVQRCGDAGVGVRFTNGATVEDWKCLEYLIRELRDNALAKNAAP
ncbi:MAG TPA: PilZ domain-containing protein [Terriglobales bacterium]|nr:PilZ domain-containing protein [Terriglobales bacterium]